MRPIATGVAALFAVLVFPATAPAFYGNGATIVSASLDRLEQGDDASGFAAVSGNGRYVAFSTRARNFFADDDGDPSGHYRVGGIFRRDLDSGELVLVADGDLLRKSDDELVRRGASEPSISADGRYVSFQTAYPLAPEDTNDNFDVYVRDMTRPVRAADAFELVSARDGSSASASYEPPGTPFPGGNPGAETSRGSSISADGQVVVFKTADVRTDLPASPATDTPGGQLFVRNRAARTTTLATRSRADGSPAGGAAGPAGISADGSTVVWTGKNAPAQTRFLPGEIAEPGNSFYLWRRIADGAAAPTRRITGAVDPDDPACPDGEPVTSDPTAVGPCYGPLTEPEAVRSDIAGLLPALSADGRTLAFLTGGGPRPNQFTGPGLDLWITDMSPGVSRKAGTVELTREGNPGDSAASPPIDSVALSADGRLAAIASQRTTFVLPALRLVTPVALTANARELYVVDLGARTIERATRDFGGGEIDPDGLVRGISITADGARIGFTSFSPDHFFGDSNARPDAFVVTRQAEPPVEVPPPEPEPEPPPAQIDDPDTTQPTLRAQVKATSKGTLRVTVEAPSAGSLEGTAKSRLRVKGRARQVVVAKASKLTKKAGRVVIVLKPGKRYMSELKRKRRLATRISLTFETAPSRARITRSVRSTFRLAKASKK